MADTTEPASPTLPGPTDEAAASGTFAGYRLVRLIGQGGMGAVYEAEQASPRRAVALKVIRPGWATPAALRRFDLEAEILGRLEHPGVARIYEAGVGQGADGQAQPFFAMELVRGRPLTEYAAERRLTVAGRLALFAAVCDAVQHAHQQGVIHRDLKPSNILVTEDGGPKVLDFGVARLTADGGRDGTATGDGQVVGTLQYMSPEQAAGDAGRVDTRADVYALGLILYELLAGRPAFALDGRPLAEVLEVIRDQAPAALSSVDRRLRGDLETIVGTCLAKEPGRRYAGASAVAADVRRYLNFEPIAARPPSAFYHLARFARRNVVLVGGVAAVFVALVLGVIGTSVGLSRARDAQALAERRRTDAEDARKAADAQREVAELGLAENWIAQGDLLGATSGWDAARARYAQAAALLGRLGRPLRLVDLAELDALRWSPPPLVTLGGHSAGGLAVAVGADGRTIVTGAADGGVRVWDGPGGVVRATRPGAGRPVVAVALAEGDSLLAVANAAGAVRVDHLGTGETVARFSAGEAVRAIAPVGPGWYVVGAGRGATVWEADGRGAPRAGRRFDHGAAVSAVAATPDGRVVVTTGEGGRVKVWDGTTGALAHDLDAHRRRGYGVAVSADGARVLSVGYDNTAKLWDARTGALLWTFDGHPSGVRAVAISADGRVGLTGGEDRTVRVLDLVGRRERLTLAGHGAMVTGLAFSPDGSIAVSGAADGTARAWAVSAERERPAVVTGDVSARAFFVSDDGARLVGRSAGGSRAWERSADGGAAVASPALGPTPSWCAPALDGTRLVALADGRLRFWAAAWPADGAAAAPPVDLTPAGMAIVVAGISKDRARVVVGGADGRVVVVELPGGRVVDVLRLPRAVEAAGFCGGAAWAACPGRLAVGGVGGAGERTLTPPARFPRVLAVSADAGWALCQSADQLDLMRWPLDGAPGSAGVVLPGHNALVTAAAVGADGNTVLSGGADGRLRVWDSGAGRLLRTFTRHRPHAAGGDFDICWSLAQSTDGRVVAATFGDGTVEVWDFARPAAYREWQAATARALAGDSRDAGAREALAGWYAFRGAAGWAAAVRGEAGRPGGTVVRADDRAGLAARVNGVVTVEGVVGEAYWSVSHPDRMYVEFRGSLRSKLMAVVSRGAFDGRGGGPMAADPDGVLGGARARVTGRLTAQGGALLLSVARAADVEVVTAAPPARVAADGPPVAVDLNDVEAVERALYRTVVVEGTAGAVGQAAGPVVGWPMREYGSGFQVVVRSAARPAIEARHGPLAELEGRRIRVTGRLRTYWGRPEVVVTGAGQVEVVGGR